MKSTARALTPDAMLLREALHASAPLLRLRERMEASRRRYDSARPCLGTLAPHVTPGPIDEEGWSLLAANGAVAAKLRQLQPRIAAALAEAGWPECAIRIKVLGR